ncbi:OstA-like protein [uncultured Alistipes sp.]|uniref:OstA-like protein n=1 Tax=uncultured Alistipes sp. TaxID=538949 RepID=UPI0026F18F33|nr:OstA-like protein [uncultured Alistipes sp.]
MRTLRVFLIVALLAVCSRSVVRGQGSTATVDFRADVMTSVRLGDSTGLCLVGHVVFHHNGAVITCDSAIRYNDRMMDCFRNVVVNKDSTFVYGDKASYNGEENEAQMFAPLIKMVDRDATLYTYHFKFNTLNNIGRYFGGGTMRQNDNRMESEEGYYYADTRELIGVRRVEMSNPDYRLKSDSVSYNMDTEVASFDTVSYIWNAQDEFLTARRGIYDRKEDRYTFTDDSYIMTEEQEIWADTILYRSTDQDATLLRNVQIADEGQKALAFGDYARYWGAEKKALLTRDPAVASYEEGPNADTVFMRSDSMFIFTIDRFAEDSLSRQPSGADSLASGDEPATPPSVRPDLSAPSETPAEVGAESGRAGRNRPAADMPPSSAEAEHEDAPAGEDAAVEEQDAPRSAADSLQTDREGMPVDSLVGVDSLRRELTPKELKERQKALERAEKQKIRQQKDAERAAKVKAKAIAAREREKELADALRQRENDRMRKELARRIAKGKASAEDTLALLRLDSLRKEASMPQTETPADSSEVQSGAGPEEPAVPAVDSVGVQGDSVVRVVRAYRNVKVYRSDFQAVCDSLVGFTADSTIHMYIDPVLWNENNQITSETVDIYTKNKTVDKAVFEGEPLMCSQVDTAHYNQVKGKVIEAYFRKGEIYRTDVVGNGQCYYFMEDGDSTDRYINGLQTAECADITFRFADRQLEDIVYRGKPNVVIYPMDKIPETQSLEMKGFRWEIARKPSRADVFDRKVRPSQRERYGRIPQPLYPITEKIDRLREKLAGEGWIDRDDRVLTSEAEEFVRSLAD